MPSPSPESIQTAIKVLEDHDCKVESFPIYFTVTMPDGKAWNFTPSLLLDYAKRIQYHDKRKERL